MKNSQITFFNRVFLLLPLYKYIWICHILLEIWTQMLKFHYQSSFYCTYVHIARNMSSFIQWTEFFYIQCTHFMSLYFTLSEWLTRLLYFVWVGVWRWNLMKTKSMVHGKYNSNMWLLRNIVFASLSSNNAFFLCFVDKHILIRDISVSDILQNDDMSTTKVDVSSLFTTIAY